MLRYSIALSSTENDILATYGVHVSSAKGLLGRPEFKDQEKFSWDYLHGEMIDLYSRRYKPREITMKCWLKASTKQNAINSLNSFLMAFTHNVTKLVRLHVEFLNSAGEPESGNKGLFFLVYLSKFSMNEVKWRKNKQILEFELQLTEPSPLKRVYKVSNGITPPTPPVESNEEEEEQQVEVRTDNGFSLTATFTSTSEFDIHWGDGSTDYDCIDTGTETHSYQTTQTYYVIVTGVLDDISAFSLSSTSETIVITQIYSEI